MSISSFLLAELRNGMHGKSGDFGRVVVERMARDVEAEQFLLVAEPFAQRKIGHARSSPALSSCDRLHRAEQIDSEPWPASHPLLGVGLRQGAVDLRKSSARFGPKSSQAPDFTRLSSSFLLKPRDSTRAQKSSRSGNGPPFARLDDELHRGLPTFLIAERPKRIGVVLDGEDAAAFVDARRQHLDAHRFASATKSEILSVLSSSLDSRAAMNCTG